MSDVQELVLSFEHEQKELVFKRWPHMWKILQDKILAGMNACGGRDGN